MRLVYLLTFTVLELAAMQQVEIPDDITGVAKSIILQSGRPESKANLMALQHSLLAAKKEPSLPPLEQGHYTKFESLKLKFNRFLTAPKLGEALLSADQAAALVQTAEKLVDEALDFWAGSTTDAATAQKRQKMIALITSGISLTGNVALLVLTTYYGLGSKCTNGSQSSHS